MKNITYVFAGLLLPLAVIGKVTILPNVLHNGSLTDETVAGAGSLDGQKLSTTSNETTYEWWYFDVVSTTSQNESVNIIFYNAGPEGFPGGYLDGPLSVEVSGSFANGSVFDVQVPAKVQAVITKNSKGLEGDWQGSGAKFFGSPLTKRHIIFNIEIDSPEIGVTGRITMHSHAPPRYTCSANVPGANELAFRDVGWSNAVPDSNAKVDITVGDTPLDFTGLGYHDHNWGLTPFASNVGHTYWGHARVGPYSVVWSDGQIPDDEGNLHELVSGTVAKDGKLLTVNCDVNAVSVRPWGTNDEYPPTVATGPPEGLEIRIDLGAEGTLALNITGELLLIEEPVYTRAIGSVRGGLVGCDDYEGKALFEQFKLIGATASS